jgi:hypothetical protein
VTFRGVVLPRSERTLVQVASAETGRFRNLGGGFLESNALADQRENLADAVRKTCRRRLSTGDNETDLATSTIGKICRDICGRTTPHLFVKLGEFATDGDASFATQSGNEIGERSRKPIGRLEEHHGSGLPSESREVRNATLARKKTLEGKTVGRKTAEGKRGQNGARSWQYGHNNSCGCRGRNQRKPRIADRRHPRIREHKHILLASKLNDLGRPRILVVFVKGNKPRSMGNTQRTQQVNRRSRVFGGDDADRSQRLNQTTRDIAEIPDRGRSEDDHDLLSQSLTSDADCLG